MNGEAFVVYVEKKLVPSLSPGDLDVIDNLPAHKVESVRSHLRNAPTISLRPDMRRPKWGMLKTIRADGPAVFNTGRRPGRYTAQ
jgi:hypothetical protein